MLVAVEALSKRFGRTVALDQVSFSIGGGAVGLLGPNGSGKTTLLRILLGLLPAKGTASVLGLDPMRRPREVRARIGYVPESECIVPGLTGVDVVAFLGRLAGMSKGAARKRAHEVTYFVGLDEERYREASEYSQGMQQRLKLATALVHDPDVLFLDEPTNGLDPAGRLEMLDLIRELATEHGKHVLLSSHLLQDVERVCTEVVMLRSGRLLRHGTLAGLTSAGDGSYRVRVRGDEERFVAELRAAGGDASGQEDLLVTLPAGASTDLVFRVAHAALVQVRALAPTRRTLEDVFLEEMEGDDAR